LRIDLVQTTALAVAARAGDAAAFDELVRTCDRVVLELAERLLLDHHEAEDVRQWAWFKAWRALPGYDARASFPTWLYRIVVNACRDRARTLRRAPPTRPLPLSLVPKSSERASGPAGALEHAELRERVVAAIESLPADEREAVLLRHYHELNASEIADVVGRPRTTVQSCLARALSRLAIRLKAHAEPPVLRAPVARTP
jgi:RNA polymerase sigma-70 factor (ECF subfamily)